MDILLRFFTWDWRNTFATLQRDQVANLLAILRYDRDLALPCDGSICSARHRSAQAGILRTVANALRSAFFESGDPSCCISLTYEPSFGLESVGGCSRSGNPWPPGRLRKCARVLERPAFYLRPRRRRSFLFRIVVGTKQGRLVCRDSADCSGGRYLLERGSLKNSDAVAKRRSLDGRSYSGITFCANLAQPTRRCCVADRRSSYWIDVVLRLVRAKAIGKLLYAFER